MDDALREIYVDEMRQRLEKLKVSLALTGSADGDVRRESLYDAHVHAHTVKGTSEQVGFTAAGKLGASMSDVLATAREENHIEADSVRRLERACDALLKWLDSGMKSQSGLAVASATFDVGGPTPHRAR